MLGREKVVIVDESRFTYRCDPDLAMRIKAVKDQTGWSFQKLTDEFWKTLLWKIQTETAYFKDLTITKKIEYTVKDVLGTPSLRNFFRKRT